MKRFSVFLLAALCALAAPLASAADKLVIYSGRSDKFVKPVVKAFTEQTGIEVVLHNAKSTALLNKLRVEGKRTEADLFVSNDAGNLQAGADFGLFQAIPADMIASIGANYRAADNSWVGVSARARVLVVNTQADTSFIKSVFDLADARLKGRLGITDSTNESFIAGVSVYQLSAGEERTRKWLEGIKANSENKVFSKHSKIVAAVASGKKDVGLVNHYYIYRHLAKHPQAPVRILIPDQGDKGMGVAWNVAGVAISKYSKHTVAARKFVEFVTSSTGQKLFAETNNEYPTRADVPAAPAVPAAGSYKVADVPMAELARHRGATLNLLDSVGMP